MRISHVTERLSPAGSLKNMRYTEVSLRRHVHSKYQNYQSGSSCFDQQQFIGEILDKYGNAIEEAKGSGHIVHIPISVDTHIKVDMKYALLIRKLLNSTANISAASLAFQTA